MPEEGWSSRRISNGKGDGNQGRVAEGGPLSTRKSLGGGELNKKTGRKKINRKGVIGAS